MKEYGRHRIPSLSNQIRGNGEDSEPFGADAGFLEVSSFFNGKVGASTHFNASEIKDGTPLGVRPLAKIKIVPINEMPIEKIKIGPSSKMLL